MGTLYVLKYFLAILNEMNKPSKYRPLTLLAYCRIVADVERAKRSLTMRFLGDSGVKVKQHL